VQHAEEFMGLIKPASKLYMRFFITEQAKAGLERLKDEKSVKAEQARAKYLDILGKYNLVDQEDIERIPFEDILPISMEFTDDAKVAGFSPLSHAERINMRKKWRKKAGLDTIEDVEFEDIDDAEN
jgi:2-oxo-4-hydroxy-4-carboxy--5-ureidoimidazoline (OHCU) decarboxylase